MILLDLLLELLLVLMSEIAFLVLQKKGFDVDELLAQIADDCGEGLILVGIDLNFLL